MARLGLLSHHLYRPVLGSDEDLGVESRVRFMKIQVWWVRVSSVITLIVCPFSPNYPSRHLYYITKTPSVTL